MSLFTIHNIQEKKDGKLGSCLTALGTLKESYLQQEGQRQASTAIRIKLSWKCVAAGQLFFGQS